MKHTILLAAAFLLAACAGDYQPKSPKDALKEQLAASVARGSILYGHQDDLSYGHFWTVEDWRSDAIDRSDVKAVSGKYPAVVGFDLGGIELGDSLNLDGVPFGLIRKAARAHVNRGGIVTLSWHPRNLLTGGDAWDVSSPKAVQSILPGGEKHEEFCLWLWHAADFVESLGVPVIFRPWHENSASWFWWGKDLCTESEYMELFRFTRDYFDSRQLSDVLWCYSPNGPFTEEEYLSRYPGDDYVDLLGADLYEFAGDSYPESVGNQFVSQVKEMLSTLTAIGEARGKMICLSETGLEGLTDPRWWTQVLYRAIKDYPIAYVLTWRNAYDRPGHFYAPWAGFTGAPDFVEFSGKERIQLLKQ